MSPVTLRPCPHYGACRYPQCQQKLLVPANFACSGTAACIVEEAAHHESLLHTLDQAQQIERNAARGLPWHCGCEDCASGRWDRCYSTNGPAPEIRALLISGTTSLLRTTAAY